MTISSKTVRRQGCIAATAIILVAMLPFQAAFSQGTENPEAVDAIVGSEVLAEEESASANSQKVIAAIEKSEESTGKARTVSKLDKVEIVFLTDAAKAEGGPPPPIADKVKQYEKAIAALRDGLEGNAMLYHALNSRQVLVDDIIAVAFDNADGVVIYAAAKPPAQ